LSKQAYGQLERMGVFGEEEKELRCYAMQYFQAQQALFDSIYLFNLLKEDHYQKQLPAQQEFLNDYLKSTRQS